jgi:hypothetical protein
MNMRDALLTIAGVAMLVYLRPAWPRTLLDNPSSCTCAPSNWPPDGNWQANSGKGNLGQDFHSDHTDVWTHACRSGGTALDEIMFKLFGEQASSTAGAQAGTSPPTSMTTIRNVSIYASPVVPDRGGHSILGGLLTGKGFGAINPNLAVCLQVPGASGRVCTPVCKPGHECMSQPFDSVVRHMGTGLFTIGVFDVDRPGSVNTIVVFQKDPAKCTAAQHCKIPVTDTATYGDDANVEIAFNTEPGHESTAACDPTQAHIIQFVSSEICSGGSCGHAQTIQSGLEGYDQGGCGTHRSFGVWYLDNGDCSEPYLTPEMYCGDGGHCGRYINDVTTPLRFVVDEPSVALQAGGQGNYYQMQKHFVDFVMCGAEVKDVLQWTRTGIGAQACGSRTLHSNYEVQKAPSIQTLQAQLCDVARAGGKYQGDGAASFGGVQVYLNCPL